MKQAIWTPSPERVSQANMTKFIDYVNKKNGLGIDSYDRLYDWSIRHAPDFWAAVWEFGDVIVSKTYHSIVRNLDKMSEAEWFLGAELNFAQNLLRYRDDRVALVFKGESSPPVSITYAQLYDQTARLAASLRRAGVQKGDRVAGFMPNMIETVAAMLATVSIGAIWSSCSPDFGLKGVLDRFGQIQPKVLFTANGYYYNGKAFDSLGRIAEILKELPCIEQVVVVPYTEDRADLGLIPNAVHYSDFLSPQTGLNIIFEQLPFNHPLYIMYSSGTTGVPKCIVHGAGGTLIQHLKELLLHADLKREDTIFYFTTCGWMMWNWLVSSLAGGATLVLYDGSPFYPDDGVMFQLAQDQKISIFGTSARYLAEIEKRGLKPGQKYDLSALKAILSTGSPLSVESFRYVYREIKQDLVLSSISGGTDIISCFALGNPIGPVYEGELQTRGLGMKVEALDQTGRSVTNEKAELVCSMSFPSMPIYFWNDQDGQKYHNAYFSVYPNTWHHGDYIEITDTGGVVIYGRSDATLNPGGVRIGTAEIYRQVESVEEVADSLVIGQDWENDVRVVLFVKLKPDFRLTEDLVKKIKQTIRQNTTPRHVPAKVIDIADIPYTISGKKVELAVRNILHGRPVLNRDALTNPAALDLYKGLAELSD
ncbi:MAG: acetoacetate--CoA ligase [Deltaproteobacteria bacterium]|nr:acetoacetate--CoA ligase [Deltaproteobacteria bacterium]